MRLIKSVVPAFLFSVLVCQTSLGFAQSTQRQEIDAAFLEAKTALDKWRGGPAIEHIFATHLSILEADPSYAPSYVELARIVLKTSAKGAYGPHHEFTQDGMAVVRQNLDEALTLDPKLADAWVLYGYAAANDGQPNLALAMFDKAEVLGTDSFWLPLNRAQTLEIPRQPMKALQIYSDIHPRLEPGTNEYQSAAAGYRRTVPDDIARFEFQQSLTVADPDVASHFYGHAKDLLGKGDYVAAQEAALQAVSTRAYRQTLGLLALTMYCNATIALQEDRPNDATVALLTASYTGVPLSELMLAALSIPGGDIAVPLIISSAQGPEDFEIDGDSWLTFALNTGNNTAALQMIEAGIGTQVSAAAVNFPLHRAVSYGMHDVVAALIERGADVNAVDRDGAKPLNLAILQNDQRSIKMLRDAGGSANPETWTALVEQVGEGDPAAIDSAVAFLQLKEPGNVPVRLALEQALIRNPLPVINAANKIGLHDSLCAHSAEPNADAAVISLQRRFAAVDSLRKNTGHSSVDYAPVYLCYVKLHEAQTSEPPLRVPSRIQPTDFDTWVAHLQQMLDKVGSADRVPGEARQIASLLQRTQPAHYQSRLLSARVDWMTFSRGQMTANEVQWAMLAAQLDSLLGDHPHDEAALQLYRSVLTRQNRAMLAALLH